MKPFKLHSKRTGEEQKTNSPSRLFHSGNRLQKRMANHLERFPRPGSSQELYTSYEHVIIKPSMICPDFFVIGKGSSQAASRKTPETALTRRRLFPVYYLPDVEEKIYRYRYHIHIIETEMHRSRDFPAPEDKASEDISRTHFSRSTDFPSISAGQNESKRKDLKTHGHECLFPWQA